MPALALDVHGPDWETLIWSISHLQASFWLLNAPGLFQRPIEVLLAVLCWRLEIVSTPQHYIFANHLPRNVTRYKDSEGTEERSWDTKAEKFVVLSSLIDTLVMSFALSAFDWWHLWLMAFLHSNTKQRRCTSERFWFLRCMSPFCAEFCNYSNPVEKGASQRLATYHWHISWWQDKVLETMKEKRLA